MAYQTSDSNYGLFPSTEPGPIEILPDQEPVNISAEEEQGIIADFVDMMQQGAYGAAADMLAGVRGLLTDDKVWTMEESLREGVSRQQETLSQAQKDANENFGMFGDDTEFSARGLGGAVASGLGSTLPFMVAGGGAGAVGRAAMMKLAAQKAAQGGISAATAGSIGSGLGGAVVGAPAIGGGAMNEAEETLSRMTPEQLQSIPSFENYIQAAAGDVDLAKEVYIEDAKNAALKQGAALGAVSMGVAAPFLEKLIKGGYGFLQGVKTGAATEFGQEAFESGGQRRIINPIVGNPNWKDVLVDAGEGAVIGAIAGGIGGGAFSARGPKDVIPSTDLNVDTGNEMLGLPDMGASTGEFIIHPDGSESRASDIFNMAMQESGGDNDYAQSVVDNIRANATRQAKPVPLNTDQYLDVNADINQSRELPLSPAGLPGENTAGLINRQEPTEFKRRPSQRPENQDAYNTVQTINQPEPTQFKESPSKGAERDQAYDQYQGQQEEQKATDSDNAYNQVKQPGVQPGQMFTPKLTRKEGKAFNKTLADKEQSKINANDFRDNLGFAITEYKNENQISGELENATLQHLIETAYARTTGQDEDVGVTSGTTTPSVNPSRVGNKQPEKTEVYPESGNKGEKNQNTTVEGGLEPKTEEFTTVEQEMTDDDAMSILSGDTKPTKGIENEQKDTPETKSSETQTRTRTRSPTNTDLDKPRSKKQLLSDVDQAITSAKSDDDLPILADNIPEKASDEQKLEIQKNHLNDIGYVTFNVPGAGTFKVLNTKEHLANFKKKIEKSSGFKATVKSRGKTKSNRLSKASALRAVEDFIKDGELENAYNAQQLSDVEIRFGVHLDKGVKKPIVYTSTSSVDLIPRRDVFVGRRWEDGEWNWAVIDNNTGNSFGQSESTKLKAVGKARADIKRIGPDKIKGFMERADSSDNSSNQEELSKIFRSQFEEVDTTPEPTHTKPKREKNEKTKNESVSPDKRTSTKTDGAVDADSKAEQKVSDSENVDQFKDNKLFTQDAVEAARARLKKKLGTLNSGFDPEIAMDGLILGGAYIESGVREFGEFSKAVLADIGENAKPYLRSWYEAARHYPGLDTEGMTSTEKIEQTQGEENDDERESVNNQITDKQDSTTGVPDKEQAVPKSGEVAGGTGGTIKGSSRPSSDNTASGSGNEVRADDSTMEGQQTDGGSKQYIGGATSENGNVSGDTGPNDARLNYDLRNKPNISLTPAKRRDINNKAKEILNKPVNEITDEDKEILRQYTGAGGLNLKDSVDEGAGIFNQHYTNYDTIRGIFKSLDDAGIKQTRALEPSVGSGNFIGFAPELNWSAVDIDKTNTDVVERLYPETKVSNESYETYKGKNFDLIVSNVPFASFSALPRANANTVKPQFKAIHNFFFAQSLDKLKPGGVMAFMTSTGTMDGTQEAKRLRTRLMNNADVIGAFRLPEGTQMKNASTDVSIDVIFIQKRPENATPSAEQQAKNESFIEVGSKDGYKINQYFLDNPNNVLGDLEVGKIKTSMGKLGLIVTGEPDYTKLNLDPQTYETEKKATKSNFANTDEAEQYAKDNGYKFSEKTEPFYDPKSKTTYDRVVTYTDEEGSGLLGRKVSGVNANKMQLLQAIEDTKHVELIEKYKTEYEKPPHKDLGLRSFAKNNNALDQLKQFNALFNEQFEPAEIFSKKVRFKDSGKIEVTKDSSLEERAESLENQDGVLDDREKILSTNDIQKLLDSGAYARISNTKLQNSKLYYAGNIYKKLDALKYVNPAAQRNKQRDKLESIKPEIIPIERISITGKESWLPDSAVTSIGKEHLSKDEVLYGTEALDDNKELELYNNYLKGDALVKKDKDATELEHVDTVKKAQRIIDTIILPKIKAKIIDDGLGNEIVESYNRSRNFHTDPDFKNITLKHIPETFRGKPFTLRQLQEEGIERGMYNKKGVIAFAPGLGKTPTAVVLADQQMRRGIFKKPLFVVPANTIPQWIETTKELYPNAKIYNYPLDRKGVPKDWVKMTQEDKDKMLYDLTNNQYDYTFVSTNLAQKFRPPMKDLKRYIDNLANQIVGMEESDEGLSKSQLKAKEKRLAAVLLMKNTMLKAYGKSTFDMSKLGFDAIFADEVQYYKNIGMQAADARGGLGSNVSITVKYPKGTDGKENKDADPIGATIGSSRSYDFRFKTQYISENNNGNNVFLLTGTPTPNKPLELMTLLHHLDTHILDEYGITNISQFVEEFFEVSEVEVVDVSGKAKMSPELSGVKNVDSLKKIIGRYIDYRSPESAKDVIRPKEKQIIHTVLKSATADKIFADIQKRLLQAVEDTKRLMSGEVGKDEYIERVIQMYTAGRDASIDIRLYNPTSKSEITPEGTVFEEETRSKYSKIAKTVELVAAKNAENPDAGQLIFIDRLKIKSTGESLHSDIRDKIIASSGLDPKEVVYVNAQGHVNPNTGTLVKSGPKPERLQQIIDAYNKGDIKVLIGNTAKLGVGVDLQIKTTDVYQIDKPYRPDEVEQRTNRAVRQGNENSEVTVHFFYQPGTFDDMSDRLLANKQGFNDVFWKDQNESNIDVSSEGAPDAYSAAIELETDPVLKRKLEIERDIHNSGRKTKDIERNISNLVKHGRVLQKSIDQYRNSIEGIDTRPAPAYEDMNDKDRAKAVRAYKARMKIQREKHVVNLDRLSGEFSETSLDLDKRKEQLVEHREYISNLLNQFSVDGVIDVDKVSTSMTTTGAMDESLLDEKDRKSISDAFKSIAFNTGTSKLTPEDVVKKLPRKNRKMVESGKIKVLPNVAALRQALQGDPEATASIGDGTGIEGVYYNDTVYLVANKLTPETIIPTLNHELFHSYLDQNPGVKSELLDRQGNVYDAFSDMFDRDYNRKYRPIMSAAMNAVNAAGTNPEDRIEELAAYMVTEWSKNPQGLMPKLRKAVMELVAYIKALAFRAGIDVGKLTPADLTALARTTTTENKGNTPGGSGVKLSKTGIRSQEDLIDSFKKKAGQGPKQTLSDSIGKIIDDGIKGNKEKINDWWKEVKPRLVQGIFDKHLGIKLAEQNVLGEIVHATSGYIGARLSTGSSATMRALLKHGSPIWKAGVIAKKEGTQGFVEILTPVKDDIESFTSWMVAKRAKRLYSETWTDDKGMVHRKENNFDIAEIEAVLKTEKPEYQGVADGIAEMNNNVLDLAVEAGIINDDSRKLFQSNDYIPFYRVVDSGIGGSPGTKKGLSHQTSGIKMLKGGENPMSDPLGNLMKNWNHLIDASMKNSALDKTLTNLEDSDYVTKIPSIQFEKALIPKEQIRALMLESGLPKLVVDLMPDDVIKGVGEMWAMKAPKDPDTVRVMRDGKAEYYKVNDGMLLTSLVGLDQARLGGIFKPMRYMKSLLTRSVTATPTFMATNFIRDSLHSFTVAEEKGFKLGIDSFKGAVSAFKEDALSIDMMFSGASFQGGYGIYNDPENAKASMDAVMRVAGVSNPKGFSDTIVNSVEKYMDMYRAIGDAVENSNRDAIARNSKDAGDSSAKYLFESKDVMDFSMGGSFMLVRALSDMLPFFNARLQGIYRLARAGQTEEAKKLIVAKGLSISLATLALLAINSDNEDYEALEDWDKDTYWHIFAGEHHFRIPKPFELGLIFGTIPERSARAMVGSDTLSKFSERMLAGASDTLAMNPIPQLFKPFAEVYSNTNMFTDRPIEGMADRNKLPSARYNDYTSDTMRQISAMLPESLGASPKRLEHLMRGYLGSLGMYVLGASDMVVRGMADMPSRPTMRMDRMPVLKAFYKEQPAMYTKHGTDFYNMLNEVNQLSSTINAYKKEGRGDKARELLQDNTTKLSTKRILSNTNKQVRKLRKQIGVISRSNLSADVKRERVDMLMKNYNEIVKKTVLSVDKFFN